MTLDGNFELVNTQASGTITNRGNIQLAGFSLSATEPTTFVNQGHMVLYAADLGELSLAGGGTVTLATAYVTTQLRNLDNQIRGTGNIRKLTQNAGLIEAADGVLSVESAGVPATDHTGLFAAAPGGVLEMEAAVTGSGAWRADGGLIHVTGDVETTGNIEVLHGGSLVVETQMTGGDLTVDATSTLDVNGVLRIAGNLDFDGPQLGRWSFATGAFFETSGGAGAAVGDWDDWQSLEAAGRDLGLIAAGFSSANFYLPRLIIGPDGHLFLKDGRDNGNRALDESEAVYVDTLVFSDSLAQLNLNGIRLYYNHLVGTTSQIIDVPVPEPAASALVSAIALLAAARSLRRKERSLAQS